MHSAPELTGIAIIAVAATLCGMLMVRLRQPPIIGYILSGLLLGGSGLGLVEDRESIALLAELGVILLLFFIGMELSLRSFRRIWRLALLVSLGQIAISFFAVLAVSQFFDWPIEYVVLFGFCLALSSTAVAVKVLESIGELRTRVGRITIGVLIAQDLAVAPMLVIVGNMAGDGINAWMLLEVGASVAILLGLILWLTRRRRVNLPYHHLVQNRADLAPIAALTWCFGFATLAGVFGLSPAFGAFLAGLVAGNSAQRQVMYEHAEPVQAVLLMVFFLSIGLLIDLGFFIDNFWPVMAMFVFVMVFKTALNILLLRFQGERWKNAFLVSLVLGQLGEFSFVLGAAAENATVIDDEVYRLIVIVTVLSLVASPVFTDAARRLAGSADAASFRGTLKLLYWREWRITRRLSVGLWDFAFLIATSYQRINDWRRQRRGQLLEPVKKMRRSRVKTGEVSEAEDEKTGSSSD